MLTIVLTEGLLRESIKLVFVPSLIKCTKMLNVGDRACMNMSAHHGKPEHGHLWRTMM